MGIYPGVLTRVVEFILPEEPILPCSQVRSVISVATPITNNQMKSADALFNLGLLIQR